MAGQSDAHKSWQALAQHIRDFVENLEISQRILIVDDERIARSLFSDLLARNHFIAEAVTSAEEALQRLSLDEHAVVLTDKNMPGMDGIELLAEIKRGWPRTEVLIITGYGSVQSALEAITEGAFDYIPKPPPSLTYVAEKVRSALAFYDFEVRIRALVDYLGKIPFQTEKSASQSPELRLREILGSYQDDPAHVVVLGAVGLLAQEVEELDYKVTQVASLEEALSAVGKERVHAVVLMEVEGYLDGAEATQALRRIDPDVGAFIIAGEGELKRIVKAIGYGVGDYLVRPFENRQLLAPRLKRLVERQQRVLRYRYLIEALKQLNIELDTWATWQPWGKT